MGSDMYMEAQNFRPRPNKAKWDGDELVIYRDAFYHGYTEVWRGKVDVSDKTVMSLIKALGIKKLPEKPVSREDQVKAVLLDFYRGNDSGSSLGLKGTIEKLNKIYGV